MANHVKAESYPATFGQNILEIDRIILIMHRITYSWFKGTVSWDRFQKFQQKYTELGLTKGRGWFLNF